MQNKGAILSFAILLAAVCLYQLTFTWKAKQVEKDVENAVNKGPVNALKCLIGFTPPINLSIAGKIIIP